jgi:hypothetical protein
MPVVAVIFGWPSVIASLVLVVAGLVTRGARLMLAGAIVGSPFLFYLSLTPRFRWVAPPVAVLLFCAARAVASRRSRTVLAMVSPYVALAVWVAWLVVNQWAG